MALIQLGAIVTMIRGKQKGTVFSANTSGAVMRNKSIPTRQTYQKRSRINNQWKFHTQVWNNMSDTCLLYTSPSPRD